MKNIISDCEGDTEKTKQNSEGTVINNDGLSKSFGAKKEIFKIWMTRRNQASNRFTAGRSR